MMKSYPERILSALKELVVSGGIGAIRKRRFHMALRDELTSIVGLAHISDDSDTLEKYSKDYSFVQLRRPRCVVYPGNRKGTGAN
jgi:hypothetical protein